MKNSEIINMIMDAARTTQNAPVGVTDAECCGVYPDEIFDEYVEGLIDDREIEQFEAHVKSCSHCQSHIQKAVVRDQRVLSSEQFSANELASSLNWKIDYHKKIKKRSKSTNNPFLLAAADKESGNTGQANGIAIDPESGAGSILECCAWVSRPKAGPGMLDLRGIEVKAMKKEDLQITITSPLELLEDQLEDLFEFNHFLEPFQLIQRDIVVDIIHEDDIACIFEARSLALTIIVAILNAVTGKKVRPSLALTGRIRMDGKLSAVGGIPRKIKTAAEHGLKSLIMPEENLADTVNYTTAEIGIDLHFFGNLGEVMAYLELFEPINDNQLVNEEQNAEELNQDITQPISWLTNNPPTHLKDLIDKLPYNEEISGNIIQLVERLCHRRHDQFSLSTTFILGNPERVMGILPDSPIRIKTPHVITSVARGLFEFLRVVDGINLGFLLNKDAAIHSIREVNIDLSGDYLVNNLLMGMDRNFAIITRISEGTIVHVDAAENQVKLFHHGELEWIYQNGGWKRCDYDLLHRTLLNIANNKGIPPDVVEKLGKTAIGMTFLKRAGLFMVCRDIKDLYRRYSDPLERFGFAFTASPIRNLSDQELLNYARQDGTMVLDFKGNLHAFMAQFKSMHLQPVDLLSIKSRQELVVRELAKAIECIGIVVSQEGHIICYEDNERVYDD